MLAFLHLDKAILLGTPTWHLSVFGFALILQDQLPCVLRSLCTEVSYESVGQNMLTAFVLFQTLKHMPSSYASSDMHMAFAQWNSHLILPKD